MSDPRVALRELGEHVSMPEPALERMLRRRGRKQRNQRLIAGAFALLISVLALGALVRAFEHDRVPADHRHRTPTSPSPAETPDGAISGSSGGDVTLSLRDGAVTPLRKAIPIGLFRTGSYDVAPDGRLMTFTAPRPDGLSRLYVTRLDRPGVETLPVDEADPAAPQWSPDGTRIVFAGGTSDIFVFDRTTGTSVRVVHEPDREVFAPDFSADGRTILFTESSPDGRTLNLWTIPVTGGESELLLRHAAYGSYSPDGTRIAFLQLYASYPGYGFLRLAAVDGSSPRKISVAAWMSNYSRTWRLSWSPDGTRVALVKYRDIGKVFAVNAESGRPIPLGRGGQPSWLDDDTMIVEAFERPVKG